MFSVLTSRLLTKQITKWDTLKSTYLHLYKYTTQNPSPVKVLINPVTQYRRCEFESHSCDTTLCDKVCQWLAAGRWFSPGTPVSSTNKTDCHDMTELLLKNKCLDQSVSTLIFTAFQHIILSSRYFNYVLSAHFTPFNKTNYKMRYSFHYFLVQR
jgi:hypothetical protein